MSSPLPPPPSDAVARSSGPLQPALGDSHSTVMASAAAPGLRKTQSERLKSILVIVFAAQSVALVALTVLSVSTRSLVVGSVDSPWYYAVQLAASLVGALVCRVPLSIRVTTIALLAVLAVHVALATVASGFFVVLQTRGLTLTNRCAVGLESNCGEESRVLVHRTWRLFAFVLVSAVGVHPAVSLVTLTIARCEPLSAEASVAATTEPEHLRHASEQSHTVVMSLPSVEPARVRSELTDL